MSQFHRAAAISEVAVGAGKTVVVEGKEIALFNMDGKFHAIDNTCPHHQGPLGEGGLDGAIVTCPWHGWQFDITSGACLLNPQAKLASYPTKVEGDAVLIQV